MNCMKQRSTWCSTALAIVCVGNTSLVIACKKAEPKPSPATTASPAPVQRTEKVVPWYVGTWSGPYNAETFRTTLPAAKGATKEPQVDDGKVLVGKGKLDLTIAEDHSVTGKSTGVLGELRASGEVDGETLRIWLEPEVSGTADLVCRGTVVAARKGEQFEGNLRVSTGDSSRLRVALVALDKVDGPVSPLRP